MLTEPQPTAAAVEPGGPSALAGDGPALRAAFVEWSPIRMAAAVVVLSLLSWAWLGYSYGTWPQPGFLTYALRYHGELTADWPTSLPPAHWAITQLFGVLPLSWLEPGVAVLWVTTLAVLWTGWVRLARALALPPAPALAAALLLLPGELDGIGATQTLTPAFYPSYLSVALTVLAIAFIVERRLVAGGLAVGLATLVHPGVGILALAVTVPVVAWMWRAGRARLALLLGAVAALSAPSLVPVLESQAGGATLPAGRRFDLMAEIRTPYHLLFSAFPGAEWVVFGAATVALVFGAIRVRDLRAVRVIAVIGALIALLLLAGGVASALGGPLGLVALQTPRVSPVIVLFGVLLGAAWLWRSAGRAALPTLLAVLLVGIGLKTQIQDQVAAHYVTAAAWVTSASIAMVALLCACVMAELAARLRISPSGIRRVGIPVTAIAAVLVALAFADHARDRRPDGDRVDLEAVAGRARAISSPRDIVLVPPTADEFTFYAHRPTVVTFGYFRPGRGDREWLRRLAAVMGNPHLLDVAPYGADVSSRTRAMSASYQRNLEHDRGLLCRYAVRLVVDGSAAPSPPWLRVVYRHGRYRLSQVAPGLCRGRCLS
jgi:hypothetical protein